MDIPVACFGCGDFPNEPIRAKCGHTFCDHCFAFDEDDELFHCPICQVTTEEGFFKNGDSVKAENDQNEDQEDDCERDEDRNSQSDSFIANSSDEEEGEDVFIDQSSSEASFTDSEEEQQEEEAPKRRKIWS